MTKHDRPEHEPKGDESRHEHREHRHRDKPHGTGHGTERTAYLEYLARKWQGSAPPTPQAYSEAIRLWRQLPGSVMTAPTDLGALPQPSPGEESKDRSQEHDEPDETPKS